MVVYLALKMLIKLNDLVMFSTPVCLQDFLNTLRDLTTTQPERTHSQLMMAITCLTITMFNPQRQLQNVLLSVLNLQSPES